MERKLETKTKTKKFKTIKTFLFVLFLCFLFAVSFQRESSNKTRNRGKKNCFLQS